MPREGVPYPERVLCSLKNTIAMIEQKLGLKIEKVNGVGPDPQGNVTLVSGDSALTIDEDAAQHQITVGLDRTELPTAAVTSVNGETGAVVLDASEIPYNDPDGSTDDVDEKLNVLTGVQNALQLSINQERSRAQNAEATLQTNINAAQASIPSAAADAVDNSPTIQQLVYADQNENLKITNVNQYAVGLTGNQEVPGKKTFYQPTGWLFGDRSSAVAVGSYYTLVSIPRNSISGVRGHLAIWLKGRARTDSLILSIYHNNSAAVDLEIIVPHQGNTTKTWTLSQDNDNIYLSYDGSGIIGQDAWMAQEVFSISTNLRAINSGSEVSAIPGTVIKSFTL